MSKEDVKANVTDPQAPNPVTIIGYTNEFSVQPGQDLHFMIDTGSSVYTADIVRLIGGMPDPDNSTFFRQNRCRQIVQVNILGGGR